MKTLLLLVSLLLAASTMAPQTSKPSLPTKSVWTWSNQCGTEHQLGVAVRLNDKMLYQGVLPICRGRRDAEVGRATFHFGGHLLEGKYRTRRSESVEGEIWQAGGERDALILGISFAAEKQVLLNTVHIASPDRRTSSVLDKHLVITTYPVEQGHTNR